MSNADQPAFPFVEPHPNGCQTYGGLTKREQFAAMAMQGFLSRRPSELVTPENTARWSLAFADALLAELAKGKP